MLEMRLKPDSEAAPQPDGGYGLLFFDESGRLCKRVAGGQVVVVDEGSDWQAAMTAATAANAASAAAVATANQAAADAAAAMTATGANVLNAATTGVQQFITSAYQSALTMTVPVAKRYDCMMVEALAMVTMNPPSSNSNAVAVAISINGAAEVALVQVQSTSLLGTALAVRWRMMLAAGRMAVFAEPLYASTYPPQAVNVSGVASGDISIAIRAKLSSGRVNVETCNVEAARIREIR